MKRLFLVLACLVWFSPSVRAEMASDLLLAKKYTGDIDLSEYWLSEKYDGVRAYWDGSRLYSRQGNPFHVPDWFTKGFPDRPLDGELWIGRGEFQETISTVSKDQPIDAQWRRVKYLIFELPEAQGDFSKRITAIKNIIASAAVPHLQAVEQIRIANQPEALQDRLDAVVSQGGEGLMLHRAKAQYHSGRSDDLLKVKTYEDAEAQVVGHIPGKGKFNGMLGALLVETGGGQLFRIGTGFDNTERVNPPPLGSWITYKYFGKTKKGIPRFASFMRPYQAQPPKKGEKLSEAAPNNEHPD